MPVKKRVAKVRANRITPDAISAFVAGDQTALHLALGLKPWQPSPLVVDGPDPLDWNSSGNAWAEAWPMVWEIRQELEQAAR